MKTTYPSSVSLLVRVPSLEEIKEKEPSLTHIGILEILATYTFLQQELSGFWKVSQLGSAHKEIISPADICGVPTLWIDLSSVGITDIRITRIYYKNVANNNPKVATEGPIVVFRTEKYPEDCPFKTFEISAMKMNRKFIVTYTFR